MQTSKWKDIVLVSRRRVFFVTLVVLLLLDLGRSVYARVGYRTPAEIWDGEPYADMTWPPAANAPPDASLGERVFIERCAICHGPEGKGNGPAAPSLIPRPRDFTLGQFKYKTTPAGQPPIDDDLYNVIANGLRASAMPYFHDILADEEVRAVIDHIKGLSSAFDGPAPEALTVPERVPPDEASLARGEGLYTAQCASCHGPDARGGLELVDARGYPVISRDLTAPWTFRGGSEPEQLWLRVTTGLAPAPMPAFAETMMPEERWDVVNYVLSLARTPPWEPGGQLEGPGHQADLVKRGEYIIHYEMCGLCHTQVNPGSAIYRADDHYLSGGMLVNAHPQGVFVSRNLTSDPETGLGNWTKQQVADAIRLGLAPNRQLNFWGMPWMYFYNLTEEDALAIASYLKTLPPVRSRIPPMLRYGFVETIIGKIPRLPFGAPRVLTYGIGSRGEPNPDRLSRDWPQRLLIGGQWLILIVGAVAFVFAGPRERRFPRRARGWMLLVVAVLGSLICGLIAWAVYNTPAVPFLPPDQVGETIASQIQQPDPATFDTPEQAALAERGRYLFATMSCAYCCHRDDGAGGAKLSAQGMGSIWTRNISSDPATGIGAWSDAEIARAIRSGISRDGRQLHWQAMPWDHFSNLDEEDVRAIIVYLRTLPPVDFKVPDYRPPSPDDCEVYTFWIDTNLEPGCR